MAEFGELLTAAAGAKVVAAYAKGKEFQQAARLLADIAADDALDAGTRHTALALIGKVNSTLRGKQAEISAAAQAALRIPPPDPRLLAGEKLDYKAREYIAELLQHARGDWLPSYAATALVHETKSGGARGELAKALFRSSRDLDEVLLLLARAVAGSPIEKPGTQEPDEARARLVGELFSSLVDPLRGSPLASGNDLAGALNELLATTLLRHRAPRLPEVRLAAAHGVLAFVHTLVRTRFSLAADPRSYSILKPMRGWFAHRWPAELGERLDLLAATIREAMLMLARQGKVDRELFNALATVLDERERAIAFVEPVAGSSGVAPDVQTWLRSGGAVKAEAASDDFQSASWLEADRLLADAVIRATRLRSTAEADGLPAIGRMRELGAQPELTRPFGVIANLARGIGHDLALLMAKRSLELFGTPGEQAEYDPHAHESQTGRTISTAQVAILQPGVRRRTAGGVTSVIKKAIVSEA